MHIQEKVLLSKVIPFYSDTYKNKGMEENYY